MLPMGSKRQMYFSGCGMFVFGIRNMVIRRESRDVREDLDVANKGSL